MAVEVSQRWFQISFACRGSDRSLRNIVVHVSCTGIHLNNETRSLGNMLVLEGLNLLHHKASATAQYALPSSHLMSCTPLHISPPHPRPISVRLRLLRLLILPPHLLHIQIRRQTLLDLICLRGIVQDQRVQVLGAADLELDLLLLVCLNGEGGAFESGGWRSQYCCARRGRLEVWVRCCG
jgi:hypothetical protein